MEKEITNITENETRKTNKILWQAPEHEFFTKGPIWDFTSVLIAALLIFISLWQGNFLFAVFIVIAELVLFFTADNESPNFSFRLEKNNLFINEKFYSLGQFKTFSILEREGDLSDLEFQKSNNLSFSLKIPVKSSDIEKVRSFLHNYLDEVEHNESLIEAISRFIGF